MNLLIRKILCILIITFCSLIVSAHPPKNKFSVGLGLGLDVIQFRDLSASPLKYSGFGLPIYGQLAHESRRFKQTLSVSAISDRLTNNYPLSSRSQTELLTWNKHNITYHAQFQLKDSINFLGGSIQLSLFYREYDFLDGQSWESLNSVSCYYQRKVSVSQKYEVFPSVSLPLFAFIHRQPSLTLDEQFLEDLHQGNGILKYGEWRPLFSDWFGLQLSIDNRVKLNDDLCFFADAGFQFYTIAFPERVDNINYTLICGLLYQF